VVTAKGSGLSYTWHRGNLNLVNGLNISGADSSVLTINPTSFLDTASNYYVVVSGVCGVNDTSNFVKLQLDTAPVITVEPTDKSACVGDVITLNVTASGNGLSYQWHKGNVLLSNGGNLSGVLTAQLTINPTMFADTASNYYVVVKNNCGLSDTSTLTSVLVSTPLVVAISSNSPVCKDSIIRLSTPLIAGAGYNWTGPNGFASSASSITITNATTVHQGLYNVIVTQLGCASQPASTLVEVKDCLLSDFFIPEGFSPNGDGINDKFVIRGINQFPGNAISIYSRWGVKVYSASPYISTWDGTSNSGVSIGGDALPIGTYFYILDLGNGEKVIQGTIYLNR
jgi:gliding motility-associated-like protein